MMTGEIRYPSVDELRDELEGTASWRQGLTDQHPDDNCNAEAARRLFALAAGVDLLLKDERLGEPSRLVEQLRDAVATMEPDRLEAFAAEANQYRSRIGFDHFPTTIEDYLVGLLNIIDRDVRFIEGGH